MYWRNWQIGLVFGIPIKVHPSWFFVFLFVTWTLATGYLPVALPGLTSPRYWVLGAIASVLMFVSVLLHELGHSVVALRYRIPIGQITLFIFGGVAHMKREPPGPLAEFLIAIAGPIVSFTLGAFCFGLESFVGLLQGTSHLRGLLVLSGLLAMVNINLGVFNLIPGFPLDGGRALRAGLWALSRDFHTATSQASLIGVGVAVLIGIAGGFLIVGALTGALPGALATNGLWVVIIGAFLFATARHSRRQAMVRASLAGVPVSQLMVRMVVDLKPEMSLEQAVNQCFLPYGYSGFPVVEGAKLVGFLTVRDVQGVPVSLWPWRTVGQLMTPASPALVIQANSPVTMALDLMVQQGSDRLVVLDDDRVVGLVTRSAITHFLQLHSPQSERGG